jgi:hypothetical protein
MEALATASAEKGLYNHMFAPAGALGPIACMWEVEYGVDVAVLQEHVDTVVGGGVMNNHIKKCVHVLPPSFWVDSNVQQSDFCYVFLRANLDIYTPLPSLSPPFSVHFLCLLAGLTLLLLEPHHIHDISPAMQLMSRSST